MNVCQPSVQATGFPGFLTLKLTSFRFPGRYATSRKAVRRKTRALQYWRFVYTSFRPAPPSVVRFSPPRPRHFVHTARAISPTYIRSCPCTIQSDCDDYQHHVGIDVLPWFLSLLYVLTYVPYTYCMPTLILPSWFAINRTLLEPREITQ